MQKRLCFALLSLIPMSWSISNVFTGGSASFNPAPNSVAQSVLDTVFDGQLQPTVPSTDWGVCTDQSQSNTASIGLARTTPVKARTIFVTYTASGCTGAAQLILDSVTIQTISSCTTNSLYFNQASFQGTSLRLEVAFDPQSVNKKLCSPEILVTDMYPLRDGNPSRSQGWSKKISDNSGVVITSFSSIPEVASSTWVADSSCFFFNLPSQAGQSFQLYLHLGSVSNTRTLMLLMGHYLVVGPDNRNTDIRLIAYDVTIDFAAETAVQSNNVTRVSVAQSGIYSIDRPNGQIVHSAKIMTYQGQDTQVCRFMPLGYLCCFVDSVTDTTVNTNTYFIHPVTPEAPIQKIFQIGFYIDFAKAIQNVLFCSLGLTATVTCTSCQSPQPVVSAVITQDGMVTVSVSSTSFTHIGAQTFQITVTDSRNIEQTSGMISTFQVIFTTCSLTHSMPLNVNYVLRDPINSQTIVTTESDTCQFTVTCSLGSGAPTWVSNSGCTFSWSTSDTTALATTVKTVPITISYAKMPIADTFTTSFTITLSCVEIFTLVQPVDVTYTIWDPSASQTIQISDSSACGYVPSCILNTNTPSWVTISNCVVSWQTNQNSVLTTASSYLIPITITLHTTQQDTLFNINVLPCKPSYSIQTPSNVNYELFTAAATQEIMLTLTGSTTCGYIPACSLSIAPQWVSASNCVIQWESNSTSISTPSTNQVQIQLYYIDIYGAYNSLGTTEFYIKLTPALSLCNSATLIASSTSLIQLEYNKKASYDLTPVDSVSTLFSKANYCGPYTAVWPSSPVSWLTLTTSGLTLELLQSQYDSENAEVQIQFSLSNYHAITTTLNISIQPKSCSVSAFYPTQTSISVDYSISGDNAYSIVLSYTVVSDCELQFAYSLQVDQQAGEAFDLSLISISTTIFEITITDESFAGQSLQFVVTATLNDKSLTTNSDLIITVNVAPIDNQLVSESNTNAENDYDQQDQSDDEGPQFSQQLSTADPIPCLISDQADLWLFQTPQVVEVDQKIVLLEVSSPKIEDIFNIDYDGEFATFTLRKSSGQPYPGFYPASITLKFKDGQTETNYATSFVIDCDAKFATVKLQTRPQPRIQKITGEGTVIVFWNQTLLPVSNFTHLNVSGVTVNNKLAPSFQVKIKPGTIQDDGQQFKFNFTVTAMDQRSLTLQLYFENPAAISKSSHSPDQLTITFNEAGLFVSQANKMSVEQGLSIQAFLPRQQLSGQVQFKINSAVGVSKGAMLASLGMPYILSSFLSQLLSVIRSFTIIVHMQAISLMCPANVVSFFSVLAPLVMFDLVPTQEIANRIFKFDNLLARVPFSLQFGQLGYPSLLVVENMGSLFFMICAFPCATFLCILLKKLLSRYIGGKKIGVKIIVGLDSLIKSAFWNFPINFFFESYLLICLVSLIGMKALVFSDYQLWTQVFCSVLALIGISTCLIFPVAIVIVYKKMLKNNEPLPDPTQMTPSAREAQFWIDDVDSILDHYFTQKQMVDFITRYGCLVEDVDLRRVGVNAAIIFPISDILRKLLVSVALVFMVDKPYFVIFTFNFTTLFYISTQLYLSPHKEYIENVRILLNEITVLFVVYHMFCFTDFVQDIQAQNSAGNSLIQIVMLNGALNVLLSVVRPVKKIILLSKRKYVRCLRKQSRQIIRQPPNAVANSSDLLDEQAKVIHIALQRAPIVDNSLSGFRVADTAQPFTTFQMPQLGSISPVNNQMSQLDQTHDHHQEQSVFEIQKPKRYASKATVIARAQLDSIEEENQLSLESDIRAILKIHA